MKKFNIAAIAENVLVGVSVGSVVCGISLDILNAIDRKNYKNQILQIEEEIEILKSKKERMEKAEEPWRSIFEVTKKIAVKEIEIANIKAKIAKLY